MVSSNELAVPQGLIAGKYQLTRLLGRGGMGAVWEGTHNSLGTHVAVKFIDAEYAESPEARSRFENEARAAAKLRSKHVVEVYDHGVSDDGRPFIVMEFLQGEPLDKRLDRVARLPPKETALIIAQVCRALMKAHAAKIVHRDLKPENVFLVWDDEEATDVAKVVDFGIAKFTDSSMTSSSATRTGSVLGTPYYMSPEQARGLRNIDYRSDLWSVAVIAYRCIMGVLPFEGEAVGDVLVNLCTSPIPVPSELAPDVPAGFDAWLAKALSRDPQERFASAGELAESLALVCGLPVRGNYSSGEIPIIDSGSGPYAAVSTGAQAVLSAGQGPTLQAITALATGAPTTQTPAPAKRTSSSRVIAAAVAAVALLGIGGGVAVKKLSARSNRAEVTAAVVTAGAPVAAVPTLLAATPAKVPEPARVPAVPTIDPSASAALAPPVKAAALQRLAPRGPARAPRVLPGKPDKTAPGKKDSDMGF